MERFGKYEVVEKIGEGGFGIVYRGYDPAIRRAVAIKTCVSLDEDLRRRFSREAEIAGNLQHRNITVIYDLGEQDGVPYLVQEYLSGEDLDRKIKRKDTLTFATRLLYLVQIARGLAYAHQQDIVHRDIKPANIRVLEQGIVKIMDFGIARVLSSESSLTIAGNTVGTAAYLAPEQVRGVGVDHRCDIYSFGILAYELLSFERAFAGTRPSEVLTRVMNDDPRPLQEAAPDLPPPLVALVERCIRKDPDRRYDDFGQVLSALDRLLRQDGGVGPLNSQRTPQPETAPRPVQSKPESTSVPLPQSANDLRSSLSTPPKSAASESMSADGPTRRLQPQGWDQVPHVVPPGLVSGTPAGTSEPSLEAPSKAADALQTPSPRQATTSWWTYLVGVVTMAAVGAGGFFVLGRSPKEPSAVDRRADSQTKARPIGSEDKSATKNSRGPDEATGDLSRQPNDATETAAIVLAPNSAAGEAVSVQVNGSTVTLAQQRRLQLAPDIDHSLVFRSERDEYSESRSITVRLEPGESRQVRSPLRGPALLTVRADLGRPQFDLWLNGRRISETPVNNLALNPGSLELGVGPAGSTEPSSTYPFLFQERERLILTFAELDIPPSSNRQPIDSP